MINVKGTPNIFGRILEVYFVKMLNNGKIYNKHTEGCTQCKKKMQPVQKGE